MKVREILYHIIFNLNKKRSKEIMKFHYTTQMEVDLQELKFIPLMRKPHPSWVIRNKSFTKNTQNSLKSFSFQSILRFTVLHR